MKKTTQKFIFALILIAFSALAPQVGAQYATTSSTSVIVENTDATLYATIVPGGYTTVGWFEYSTSSNMTRVEETEHALVGSQNSPVEFSATIEDLKPETTYYFRVVADNGRNQIKGSTLSFYVPKPIYIESLNTWPATNIGQSSARLNAVLTNHSNTSGVGYFEWGTSPSFGRATNSINTSNTSLSDTISGLAPNTLYYFRAVAFKDGKSYFGGTESFRTKGIEVVTDTKYVVTKTEYVNQNTTSNIDTNQNNNQDYSLNSANALFGFGDGFLPDSAFGWFLLILLIILIILVLRRLFR